MKIFVFGLFLTALAVQIFAQRHNVSWGKRLAGDSLIFKNNVKKSSSFLQVVTKDVTFNSRVNITFINCTDQYTNGNGGYAMLTKGGVGYRNVTIHFKSQRNHGFNFTLEIFGK